MHAHRHSTTTALGLTAVVFLVIGAVSTIGRIPAVPLSSRRARRRTDRRLG